MKTPEDITRVRDRMEAFEVLIDSGTVTVHQMDEPKRDQVKTEVLLNIFKCALSWVLEDAEAQAEHFQKHLDYIEQRFRDAGLDLKHVERIPRPKGRG